MSIRVKFFASLCEYTGMSDTNLNTADALTVKQVWENAANGIAMPTNTLAAVNMEYVALDHAVNEGDEVAFFPPVTGG